MFAFTQANEKFLSFSWQRHLRTAVPGRSSVGNPVIRVPQTTSHFLTYSHSSALSSYWEQGGRSFSLAAHPSIVVWIKDSKTSAEATSCLQVRAGHLHIPTAQLRQGACHFLFVWIPPPHSAGLQGLSAADYTSQAPLHAGFLFGSANGRRWQEIGTRREGKARVLLQPGQLQVMSPAVAVTPPWFQLHNIPSFLLSLQS